jgi:hypothetical protein
MVKGLGVSVDRHEIYPADTGIYHPVDSRAAGAAYSDYFDAGECFNCGLDFGHEFDSDLYHSQLWQKAILNAINTQLLWAVLGMVFLKPKKAYK